MSDMIAALLVLGIIGLVMAVPITAILTSHQRKMAELIHDKRAQSMDADVAARLSQEVSDLRQLVAQQAIVLDDLSMMHRRLLERATNEESIRERLNG